METLKNELSELVKTLPENTPSEVIAELNVIIYHLETYQEKIVKPIEERCENVIVSIYQNVLYKITNNLND